MKNRYMMRGVSAAKEDVHNAIKNLDKGIFPHAFCKIMLAILGGDLTLINICRCRRSTPCMSWWMPSPYKKNISKEV